MGDAISCLEHVAQKYLTPGKAPLESLPPPPDNSLLLLGEVELIVPNIQETLQFLVEGLGAEQVEDASAVSKQNASGRAVVAFGPSRIALLQSSGNEVAVAWPGHFYAWVADVQWAWGEIQGLEKKIGKSLIHETSCGSDGTPNALVLHDPSQLIWFSVNQVPKVLMEQDIQKLGRGTADINREPGNAIALVEATCAVPKGKARVIAKFYSHFLGAAVSQEEGSCKVYFAPGQTLTQTLHFDENYEAADQDSEDVNDNSTQPLPQVCFYMPSVAEFQTAMKKCAESNILMKPTSTDEFQLSGCFDMSSGGHGCEQIFAMRQVVRSPDHPQCPVKAKVEDKAENVDVSNVAISVQELAKHKQKDDLWIALNGKVYDVTKWLAIHPGGQKPLMMNAGTDVSGDWNMIHQPGTLEKWLGKPIGPKLVGRFVE